MSSTSSGLVSDSVVESLDLNIELSLPSDPNMLNEQARDKKLLQFDINETAIQMLGDLTRKDHRGDLSPE